MLDDEQHTLRLSPRNGRRENEQAGDCERPEAAAHCTWGAHEGQALNEEHELEDVGD